MEEHRDAVGVCDDEIGGAIAVQVGYDLMAFLMEQLPVPNAERVAGELRIDLSSPGRGP